jgi:iron complex outermembrane recepter protein
MKHEKDESAPKRATSRIAWGGNSMNTRRTIASKLLAGSAFAALLVPVAAAAQEQPAPAETAEEGAPGGLSEIVVTAQKRGENLQETPIAITALSSRAVELQGIRETRDLAAIAPNVNVNGATTNATAAVVSIRGIPTPADETQGYDSPIGIYLDGVYLARSSAATFEVADIERVEVLRGPQGTLFGRNTTGGAINFITSRPTSDASLKVRGGYGNFDEWSLRAILNSGDIGPDGAGRISIGYLHRQRDGIVDNLLDVDSRDPGAMNVDSVRLAFELDLADNLLLTNITDYTHIEALPYANQLAQLGDGTVRPNVTIGGFTFAPVQPANVAGYLASSTVLEPGCGAPLSQVSRDRLDTICMQEADISTDKLYGNLTRLELDLDGITVRSSTAFRWWDNVIQGSDLDGLGTVRGPLFSQASLFNGMPANLIAFVLPPAQQPFAPFIAATPVPTTTQSLFFAFNDRDQSQFSQEIEVIGGDGTAFEWVLGAFYFEEEGAERNPQIFGFVLDTNQAVFTDASFGPLGAAFRAANPARYRLVPQTTVLDYTVEGRSIAVYGQGTYRPGGADGPLGVTLGLRYTWDRKEIVRTQNGAAPFGAAELALNTRSASFSEPTGNLTVDYRAADDINLYARVARGYRSGGFNARQATSVASNIGLLPFNEEKIWSYEVGAKTEFFDRLRINAAAFYNQYSDLQAVIPIPIVGGGSFGTQVVNAGKIDYTGFEIETQLAVTDQLTLDGSVGYIHRNIKEFPGTDVTGATRNIAEVIVPTYAPDWTANGAVTWTSFVGSGDTRLTARAGFTYAGRVAQFNNPLTAPFQDATSSDERLLIYAQLRLDDISLGNRRMSLMLWGKNLTNEEYVTRGIDFGQLGMGSTIYGDPRTYGLTAEIEF